MRFVLIDAEEIVREGVKCLLECDDESAHEVVGESDDGLRGLELVADLKPDVLVTEAEVPGLNGVDVTRRACRAFPGIRVIALATSGDPRTVRAVMESGASAYVLKSAPEDELERAIRAVAAGKTYLSPDIAHALVGGFDADEGGAPVDPVFERLSTREREVLQLLAEGLTSKEAGARMFVSSKTIDAHRQNLSRKLGVDSVADLVKTAIRAGLTSADPNPPQGKSKQPPSSESSRLN